MMISNYSLFFLAVIAFMYTSALANISGERELRKELFRDYDKYVRPVKKHTTSVPVNISMTPLSLNNLDDETKVISLDSWILLKWIDEYLKWNPEDYDGIVELHIPPEHVWRPDIAVYTASPDTSLFPTVQTEVILYNNGTLLWVPPFTISSRCPVPVPAYYILPEKLIECNIRMGSWTYSEKMLDLQLETNEVDLSNFGDYNTKWKLVKVDSSREVKFFDCCPDGYPVVDFNITLRRRHNFVKLW